MAEHASRSAHCPCAHKLCDLWCRAGAPCSEPQLCTLNPRTSVVKYIHLARSTRQTHIKAAGAAAMAVAPAAFAPDRPGGPRATTVRRPRPQACSRCTLNPRTSDVIYIHLARGTRQTHIKAAGAARGCRASCFRTPGGPRATVRRPQPQACSGMLTGTPSGAARRRFFDARGCTAAPLSSICPAGSPAHV